MVRIVSKIYLTYSILLMEPGGWQIGLKDKRNGHIVTGKEKERRYSKTATCGTQLVNLLQVTEPCSLGSSFLAGKNHLQKSFVTCQFLTVKNYLEPRTWTIVNVNSKLRPVENYSRILRQVVRHYYVTLSGHDMVFLLYFQVLDNFT